METLACSLFDHKTTQNKLFFFLIGVRSAAWLVWINDNDDDDDIHKRNTLKG